MNNSNLASMLRYRRPARSSGEEEFIKRFIDPIPGMFADNFGNRILLGKSRTMISCHTDTVHKTTGVQKIHVNTAGVITLSNRELESNCLGADDTAGCYAALCMIEAGVDATYIFHRDEEIGGLGSSWLASHHEDWLSSSFDHCIALDRRGTHDIIVNQIPGDCCSDKFARALGRYLHMGHRPEWGTFTDSANYCHLIPECTNLSVGYENEHSKRESLDTVYLNRLVKRLVKLDFSSLPVDRNPLLSVTEFDMCEYCNFDYATVLDSYGSYVCQNCADDWHDYEKSMEAGID